MNNRYIIRGEELNDPIIVANMKKAVFLYEDGAIVEAASLLQNIVNAINDFEANKSIIS